VERVTGVSFCPLLFQERVLLRSFIRLFTFNIGHRSQYRAADEVAVKYFSNVEPQWNCLFKCSIDSSDVFSFFSKEFVS